MHAAVQQVLKNRKSATFFDFGSLNCIKLPPHKRPHSFNSQKCIYERLPFKPVAPNFFAHFFVIASIFIIIDFSIRSFIGKVKFGDFSLS